jgi:hypothetical protein
MTISHSALLTANTFTTWHRSHSPAPVFTALKLSSLRFLYRSAVEVKDDTRNRAIQDPKERETQPETIIAFLLADETHSDISGCVLLNFPSRRIGRK